jgi:hypothetical protein
MKPLNLYRSDGDHEVWEQAERDAKAADLSLSAHVVAVLREQQARARPSLVAQLAKNHPMICSGCAYEDALRAEPAAR